MPDMFVHLIYQADTIIQRDLQLNEQKMVNCLAHRHNSDSFVMVGYKWPLLWSVIQSPNCWATIAIAVVGYWQAYCQGMQVSDSFYWNEC